MNSIQVLRSIRRNVLKLLPEIIWPQYVFLGDVKIPVRNMPFSYGIKKYLVKGNYENAERYLVNKYLRKGDLVVDMGCSIGVVSAVISNKVGAEGRVISIEASKRIASQTDQWFKKSRLTNVKVLNGFAFPVLDASKMPTMTFVEDNGSLGGKVIPVKDYKHKQDNSVIALSDCIHYFETSPDVLVCDIEGSERIVIETEPNFPSKLRTIIIELHPSIYGATVMNQIVSKITSCGFDLLEQADDVYCFSRNT